MLKVHKQLNLYVESKDIGTRIDEYCCGGLKEKRYWNDGWGYCPFCGCSVVYGDSVVVTHKVQEIIEAFMGKKG